MRICSKCSSCYGTRGGVMTTSRQADVTGHIAKVNGYVMAGRVSELCLDIRFVTGNTPGHGSGKSSRNSGVTA
jgi:hypothetical protein